ncbi:phosphoenolpyruvate--protein phosphotransferase [Bartonella alsatica]|uniref:phosphoenolpyruvate--protein phosphotransferase n=2 Tax=Bartonella alsatica TaxID=52764 RepID=J1ISG7_9HYPH|nr:phosphoenolpyruvate--protein phosphotransferase [Bartonella alsatica]EJF74467.1 phosphoenolpyruvate-protein phosphotransferase [Bartonella alsatica IBS 382]QLC52161.1 phosphoenolpyruvate--protein phosphotransferase [Bartonella alsatica]
MNTDFNAVGILSVRSVQLAATFDHKNEVIHAAAELLVQIGAVNKCYLASMLKRETITNTWLGNGIAVPHGMLENRDLIIRDAVSVIQIPAGVEWWDGNKARLVIAIAACPDRYREICKQLTPLLFDKKRLKALLTTADKQQIIKTLFDQDMKTGKTLIGDLSVCQEWTLDYPSGLHARPASLWVDFAKKAQSSIRVRHGQYAVEMKNLVGLLQLGAKNGDVLVFSTDAAEGAQLLKDAISVVKKVSTSEKCMVRGVESQTKAFHGWYPRSKQKSISGVGASSGLALGKIFVLRKNDISIMDQPIGFAAGAVCLENALTKTKHKMASVIADITARMGADSAAIFSAQMVLLEDENLIAQACRFMEEGHGVAWSWDRAVRQFADVFSRVDNPLLAGRAVNLIDVGRRVLGEINPSYRSFFFNDIPRGVILVTDDLSPSDIAQLDCTKIQGLVTAWGGPLSHTAILARTLGIPMVVATGVDVLAVKCDVQAIIDGDNGFIYLDPTPEDVENVQRHMSIIAQKRNNETHVCKLPVQTVDGHKIRIMANVNYTNQVSMALNFGAEGIGLMRTEFLFLDSSHIPDEQAQFDVYRAMIAAVGDKPLIIRALDIGGDKQITHLHLSKEDNPFLGVRGTQLLLRRRDLLVPQLRALYRAAKEGGDLWILFPMIMSVSEVFAIKKITEEIRNDIDAPKLKLGIMIEVPAAAIMADILSAYVDFFSIGTNDLTQYTMAIDRQNPYLVSEADSLDPAVLRMIHQTIQGAAKHGCWVSVCGGMAGDPFAAMILTGLGINELSMIFCDISSVKACLQTHSFEDMKILAKKALQCETAQAVRALSNNIR